jgi:hypothetical protein
MVDKAGHPTVVALLGDIVGSRRLAADERAELQQTLAALMTDINASYRRAVLADFLVTLGDEFQGILGAPEVVPDIVQDINERLPRTRFRIVASLGQLTTALNPIALGTDGPVWHNARNVLEASRASKRDGVAFVGFGADDVVLNGISGLMAHHWSHLEMSQREVVTALRHHEGLRKEAASDMGISQQAMSNRAQSAGWREYEAGMVAWRTLLARHRPDKEVA